MLTRIARCGAFGLFGFVLFFASGCSLDDLFGVEVTIDDGSGTETATATATRPQSTPIPTNTPWTYSTATPTPVVSPTATATPRPTSTPTPTPSPTSTPSPTPVPDYLRFLPTLDQMPDDFRQSAEDPSLTAEEAAAGFGDAARLAAELNALGYRGGAYREFMLPDPGAADYLTRMLGFQATLMRFDSTAHADAAIAFQAEFAKSRQPDWELKNANIDRIGDVASALRGTAVYEGVDVKVVVVFVRHGDMVYRFISISGVYDAFDDTIEIAEDTLAR